jgi:L-asparagine transporter-like permease
MPFDKFHIPRRLALFYVLALTILVSFVPWTETGAKVVAQSPFVRVVEHTGVAHAAGIRNFVVLSAALSSMNANVYLCSRMLFSLSRGSYAPAFLGRLSKTGAPTAAILVTMGLDTEFWNISWIVGVPWLALLTLAYFIWKARAGPAA